MRCECVAGVAGLRGAGECERVEKDLHCISWRTWKEELGTSDLG